VIITDQLGSERLKFSVIKAVRTGAVVAGAVALCLTGTGAASADDTDLADTSGVEVVRIQVCRYNGDTQVACTWSDWIENNHI
jgi:hypothetical protein